MDLGPKTDVYPCPTCGVDAARAMVVSVVVAFYRPRFTCRVCGMGWSTLQLAANHMAEHEPDLGAFVDNWINTHEPRYEVRRKDP
jgi:predicted membrane-bound mannosyltransferase